MKEKTVIRLFVASPGDVSKERNRLKKIIEQINVTDESRSNCIVEIKDWKTKTYSSVGRPEEVIIAQIGEYDVFLGIMWSRFGTHTGKEESGTEEEFKNALARFNKGEIKHVGFMFSERKIPLPKNTKDIAQLSKVIAFKKKIDERRLLLYKNYSSFDEFEREIRQFVRGVIDKLTCQESYKSTGNINDIDSAIEVAKRFSSLGNYDEALNVLLDLSSRPVVNGNNLKKAAIEHLISKQYRHTGRFTKAMEHYAAAEQNIHKAIHKASKLEPSAKVLYLRIKAGRIMVDEYFLKGKCRKAFGSYEDLKPDIAELRKATFNNGARLLDLYELHLLRQQAEMLRIAGRYSEALKMFETLYDKYGFSYSLEKAYCLVGIGDSLRLNGEFDKAVAKYEECEHHAVDTKHNGLLSRVLRNKVMALMSEKKFDLAKKELSRLPKIPGNTSRFNHIYYLLASGALFLDEDPIYSSKCFSDAVSLTNTTQGQLTIEMLHGKFGLAESLRISGDKNFDAGEYQVLNRKYIDIGLNWGVARTFALCKACGIDSKILANTLRGFDFEGVDCLVVQSGKSKSKIKNFSFYSNIP